MTSYTFLRIANSSPVEPSLVAAGWHWLSFGVFRACGSLDAVRKLDSMTGSRPLTACIHNPRRYTCCALPQHAERQGMEFALCEC